MKKVNSVWFSVDCCHNDPVDVRSGGPEYLGFDFYVKPEEKEVLHEFIIESLKDLGVPLIKISSSDNKEIDEDKLWNKEKISESIIKESTYLISESRRSYNIKTYGRY